MDRHWPVLFVLMALACAPAAAAEPGGSFTEFSYQKPSHGDVGASFRVAALLGRRLALDGGIDAREHLGGGLRIDLSHL